LGEGELDPLEGENGLVLSHETVLGLGEDAHQCVVVEIVQVGHHGDTTHELGDHAVLDEVLGMHLGKELGSLHGVACDVRAEAEALLVEPGGDNVVEPDEGPAADEEDVGGVDLQELLVRVLATTLRRNVGHRTLEDLEQRLLHTLTGHIAGNRGVLCLASDLVDLVDVDDPTLGRLAIALGRLVEAEEDVLHVLSHVASLGEGGRVDDGERHLELASEGLREQRLAGSRRSDQEDIRLGQLHVRPRASGLVLDPPVVVVHGNRELLLGRLLTDHVLVEVGLDLVRLGEDVLAGLGLVNPVLGDDVEAHLDALVADVDCGPGDELAHLMLALATEAAAQHVTITMSHWLLRCLLYTTPGLESAPSW